MTCGDDHGRLEPGAVARSGGHGLGAPAPRSFAEASSPTVLPSAHHDEPVGVPEVQATIHATSRKLRSIEELESMKAFLREAYEFSVA